MNGRTLKNYLEQQGITVTEAAGTLGVTRATLHNWLSAAAFDEKKKALIKKTLRLPNNFFDNPTQVRENNVVYRTVAVAIAECDKEKAVLEERVAQLTERLAEKDATIKLLSKQLK